MNKEQANILGVTKSTECIVKFNEELIELVNKYGVSMFANTDEGITVYKGVSSLDVPYYEPTIVNNHEIL